LVGRNGEGKSTLLKLVDGSLQPDSGEVVRSTGLKVSAMPQAVPRDLEGDVYSVVASGLDDTGKLLADYHATTAELVAGKDVTERLGRLQDRIDAVDGWSLANDVDRTLTKLGLSADTQVSPLSGGMKRRVLLARAIVANPDILLLDEPTNHLDIGAVTELEETIASLSCAVLFVTHDRAFLDRVATRIVEIDRGRVTEWPGDYARYRDLKREALEAEATAFAEADKELAREEVWIRQGIKARRTRNEGRVRALENLREIRKARRDVQGTAKLTANVAGKSGKRVLEAEGVGFEAEGRTIVAPIDLLVQRGDRIGLIGPNGCGKSTLVKLLLGELTPSFGSVKEGTELQVAYLDQHRDVLDPAKSAADNVSGGRDTVSFNGGERHIMSYLQDFLFQPARARGPITALSGGELGRLVLARLFAKPSNVLILDEPSNDLDIETLELLEHMIGEYPGTVILISHDRALLENSVTRSLVYQGAGRFFEVAGGWEDFERERRSNPALRDPFSDSTTESAASNSASAVASPAASAATPEAASPSARNKLSYKLARELDHLPQDIARCEKEQTAVNDAISAEGFFDDEAASKATLAKSAELQAELDRLYARWDELESMGDKQ
jgi:ATP-binding cassette subfamily F protein uup